MGTTLSPDTVRHLLHYEGDTGLGIDGGHFVNRLIHLVKSADEDNREWLAERFPEYVAGVELLMRAHWALEWMRTLVKRDDAGLDMGDELDLMVVSPPFDPVSAAGRVPEGDVLVWAGSEVAA